jgi:uncharacterized protein YegL
MENLKPFDPQDIDESLTRIVTHGGHVYLMFPYVSGIDAVPRFESLSITIAGPTATAEDLSKLTDLVKNTGSDGAWFISFSTPWRVRAEDVQNLRSRGSVRKRH